MQEYEDGLCPDCGQPRAEAMDPDLADEWTTMAPIRDHACTALALAAKASENDEHSHALRYVVGLREGWQGRRSAARAERAAANQADEHQ